MAEQSHERKKSVIKDSQKRTFSWTTLFKRQGLGNERLYIFQNPFSYISLLNVMKRFYRKSLFSYLLFGIFFGLLFPIFSSIFDVICIHDLPLTSKNILLIQREEPLHWVIDTAPFFLGVFAAFAGIKQDKIRNVNYDLECIIEERTRALKQKNKQLEQEILDRIEAEKSLIIAKEQAEKAMLAEEKFLAHVSHEIRTPMNGITGFIYLLSNTSLSEEQEKYVQAAKYSSDHLMSIINDILDFSKIRADKLTFQKVAFHLDELVKQVVDAMRSASDHKNIELSSKIDPELPLWLHGDPVRLKQVLINLLNNAIKFTSKGEVKISVKLEKELQNALILLFAVSDTGIGISQEKSQIIFHSFRQADADTARVYGGTGLGLAISKKLVEAQKGEIWVESKEGKGSVFFVRLPFELSE